MEFLVTFSGKIPALSSVFGTQSFTINFCFYLNPSAPEDQLIQLWLLFLAHGTHLISQHFKRAFPTQSSLCSRFLFLGFPLPIAPMVFHHTFETFFMVSISLLMLSQDSSCYFNVNLFEAILFLFDTLPFPLTKYFLFSYSRLFQNLLEWSLYFYFYLVSFKTVLLPAGLKLKFLCCQIWKDSFKTLFSSGSFLRVDRKSVV